MFLSLSKSARRAIALVETAQKALRKYQPQIWDDIRGMTIASGFREAGRRLGINIPPGASLDLLEDIAVAAKAQSHANS